jgi:hypothetical protein
MYNMATPIRFAPMLRGKDAEEFYDRWQTSLQTSPQKKFSAQEYQKVKDFIAEYNL